MTVTPQLAPLNAIIDGNAVVAGPVQENFSNIRDLFNTHTHTDFAIHEADTTNIHGIVDTAALITTSIFSTHTSLTTTAHGGIVATTDGRLEKFNIKSPTYGAVGDGSANDTAALLAAIADAKANGRGKIVIPAGRYKFTNYEILSACNNITFEGAGMGVSVIEFSVLGTRGLRWENSTNLRVINLTFKWMSVQSDVALTSALEFYNCAQVEFSGCEVYNTSSLAVVFNNSLDIKCERNSVHNSARDGIHFVYCRGISTCAHNHVNITNDDGIAFWNYVTGSGLNFYTVGTQYGMQVHDNLIESTGVGRGIVADGCEGVDIHNNHLKNIGGSGIECGWNTGVNGSNTPSRRCRIAYNTLENVSTNNTNWGAIMVCKHDGVNRDVSANNILEDMDVVGNRIFTCSTVGIQYGGVSRGTVSFNTVKDANDGGAAGGTFSTGIEIRVSTMIIVAGNNVVDTRGTAKVTNGMYISGLTNSQVYSTLINGCVNNTPTLAGVNTGTNFGVEPYDASVTNVKVAAGAAIAYTKLALTGTIVNTDIAAGAAIAYTKLALANSIVNTDIAAGAAIAYSKLALTGAIVVGDLAFGVVRTAPSTAAQNTIQPSADVIPLISKGMASQSANLQEWQNSGAAVQARVGFAGTFSAVGNVTVGGLGAGQTTRFAVLASGASEISGAALSTVMTVSAGTLGTNAGDEMKIATLGGFAGSNKMGLGIRMERMPGGGTDWTTTQVKLSLDVDASEDIVGAGIILRADGLIQMENTLGLWTTSLGGGVKVVAIGNATTVPTANPTAGALMWSEGGILKTRTSAGAVYALGVTDVLTTKGDLLTQSANGTYGRLALGTGLLGVDAATALPFWTNTLTEIDLTSRGFINETYPIKGTPNAATTVPTQQILLSLMGLRKGMVITNIWVNVNVAGAGTVPTTIKLALVDKAGVVLRATANVASDAKWTSTGYKSFALTSTFTITADDGYYCAILSNGAFATTPMQVIRNGSNQGSIATQAGSGARPYASGGTGQTDITGTLTLADPGAGTSIWFGVS